MLRKLIKEANYKEICRMNTIICAIIVRKEIVNVLYEDIYISRKKLYK